MTALTWRNVDIPDFGSAITGVNNATKMLSNALESASSGLDKYKSLDAEAADRAIALRQLAYQDPAAYRQALMDGTIIGPDASRVSANMLQNLDKRVGTLADQAMKAEQAEKFRYGFAREREGDSLWDAAQADANAATREAAAGNRTRADEIIANSQAIANLRQEQADNLLTDVQGRGTGRITQDTNIQNLTEDRYDFGEKTSLDADTKAASELFRNYHQYMGTEEDARTIRNNLANDPRINSRTIATFDRMLKEAGYGNPLGLGDSSASTGSTGVSSISDAPLGMTYGGGQLPSNIQTVGDVVSSKKQLVSTNGASPVGVYQINADTWADFAPKALGANWENAPVRDFKTQDAVAKKIFESTSGDPAKLKARWASLSEADAQRISKMPWEQARDVISKGETSSLASQYAVVSPTQTRNLQVDSTTVGLLERNAQNQLGGITPEEYVSALQDTKSTDYDVALQLSSDESSPYFGADVSSVNEIIRNFRQRQNLGSNEVSSSVIGAILRKNAVQADSGIERGLSHLADIASGRFLQGKSRTPNIGSKGMRIDDEAVINDIERVRTDKLATQAESNRILGANAQALDAARATFNQLDSRYRAVLAASRSNQKLKASVANLKQQRDQAEAELNRINATVANIPELQPNRRRTISSNLNIPFREKDEAQLLREYMSRPK